LAHSTAPRPFDQTGSRSEQANAAFFAEAGHSTSSFNVTAARLVDALQSELDKTNQRVETLQRLLSR
jgi:hypothetical protein